MILCGSSISFLPHRHSRYIGFHIEAAKIWDAPVLQGEQLNAKDKYSFEHPPIQSQEDWEGLVNKTWTNAQNFAGLIEQLPESKLDEIFADEKYGTYYRNLHGIIEHLHYHLGQIVLIKKILQADENDEKSKKG